MTPIFPGLLRSMMDRVRVMLDPADALVAAGDRDRGEGRSPRAGTVYLA